MIFFFISFTFRRLGRRLGHVRDSDRVLDSPRAFKRRRRRIRKSGPARKVQNTLSGFLFFVFDVNFSVFANTTDPREIRMSPLPETSWYDIVPALLIPADRNRLSRTRLETLFPPNQIAHSRCTCERACVYVSGIRLINVLVSNFLQSLVCARVILYLEKRRRYFDDPTTAVLGNNENIEGENNLD